MAEIGDAPPTGDLCLDVVRQLVRAVRRDPDFAYLINPWSTTGERIVAVLVKVDNLTLDEARAMLCYQGREKPRAKTLEARIQKLEDELEAAKMKLSVCGLPLFEVGRG